jgi:hypothetical protein
MLKVHATIIEIDGTYYIGVTWEGVELDRPTTCGMTCRDSKLAQRLADCINAQKAYVNPKVVRDINGQSYVQATCLILGRRMNADLKRLGF